jgi:hypothetical protein
MRFILRTKTETKIIFRIVTSQNSNSILQNKSEKIKSFDEFLSITGMLFLQITGRTEIC